MDSILFLFDNVREGDKRWLFLLLFRIPKTTHELQMIRQEIKYIMCQRKHQINIFCLHQKWGECEEDVLHVFLISFEEDKSLSKKKYQRRKILESRMHKLMDIFGCKGN